MKNLKYIFLTLIVSFLLYGCPDDGLPEVEPYDHKTQALKDGDSLTKFLTNHYYNVVLDSVKKIENGETPLINDANLFSKTVTEELEDIDVELTYYYYVNNIGSPIPNKNHPTVMDSVFVNYGGQYLDGTSSLVTFENNSGVWFTLNGVIRGWTYGFTHFKGGENITNNGPITYQNGGKGILFIPSGLAYKNTGNTTIPGNANLLFYIDLWDLVENTDHDNDGVASINEDVDGDGDPRNDDTDGDLIPNFADTDDDGDGVLTKDEDANGDGNPANDFTNGGTIPDYLNKDVN